MDTATLLVMLLVVSVPAAVFIAMRRRQEPARRPAERRDSALPADFGLARETREAAPGREEPETPSGAAAAAAGGALILAAAAARAHPGDAPQAGDGPDGGGSGGGEGSGDK